MKTIMTTLALCVILGTSLAGEAGRVPNERRALRVAKKDTTIGTPRLLVNGIADVGSFVTIYEQNEEMVRFDTPESGVFSLELNTNNYYTLEIDRPGFVAKRIIIDTRLPENTSHSLPFNFEVELFKEKKFEGVDVDMMDFPMAVVHFDEQTGEFGYNKVYTTEMHIKHQQLMLKAELLKKYNLD